MAALETTISNSLNLFAGGPSSLWNAYNWGEFNWGEGTTDMIHTVEKLIANSQALTSALGEKSAEKLLSGTITTLSNPYLEELHDGSGYRHVFVSNTTDGEERDPVTWSEGSSSGSWGEVTTSTTWS